MKLNKLMAVLAAGVAMVATTGLCESIANFGITNLPLSFSGTYYTFTDASGYGSSTVVSSNLVKKGGNLLGKSTTSTTNYTVVSTNGSTYTSYTYGSYGISNYVAALNADPLFHTVYPSAPANSQLAYNLQSGEFWLTASNYAFNLSSNWWVYSWTNVIQTSRMYYTNIYTVSNTFASAYSASERLKGWYSDSCGYFYCYSNTYAVNNDSLFQGQGYKRAANSVLAFTGNLGNRTGGNYAFFNGLTNVQVGEVYTGTNQQFALTGFTVIAESQTANTNTAADLTSYIPAVTTVSLSSSLNGNVGYISEVGGYSSNATYHYYGNMNMDLINVTGGFVGTASGSKTANTGLDNRN